LFDLADVVPLGVQTRDPNNSNILSNAGTVTVTVTLPDGTTVTPPVTNPSVGTYQADYQPTQPGRHTVRWAATGLLTSGYSDVFDVREPAPPYIVSLRDAKQYLNILTTTNDEELRGFVEAATQVVENIVGPVIVRTVIETHTRPGRVITLYQPPILSLVSVRSVLTAGWGYDVAALDVDPDTGILRRLDGLPVGWQSPLRVVYRAGRPVIPASISLAAKVIIDHLWETQRGHTQGVRPTPGAGRAAQKKSLQHDIPQRARELLAPYRRIPIVF
jgi:hypothetical protein